MHLPNSNNEQMAKKANATNLGLKSMQLIGQEARRKILVSKDCKEPLNSSSVADRTRSPERQRTKSAKLHRVLKGKPLYGQKIENDEL